MRFYLESLDPMELMPKGLPRQFLGRGNTSGNRTRIGAMNRRAAILAAACPCSESVETFVLSAVFRGCCGLESQAPRVVHGKHKPAQFARATM